MIKCSLQHTTEYIYASSVEVPEMGLTITQMSHNTNCILCKSKFATQDQRAKVGTVIARQLALPGAYTDHTHKSSRKKMGFRLMIKGC